MKKEADKRQINLAERTKSFTTTEWPIWMYLNAQSGVGFNPTTQQTELVISAQNLNTELPIEDIKVSFTVMGDVAMADSSPLEFDLAPSEVKHFAINLSPTTTPPCFGEIGVTWKVGEKNFGYQSNYVLFFE